MIAHFTLWRKCRPGLFLKVIQRLVTFQILLEDPFMVKKKKGGGPGPDVRETPSVSLGQSPSLGLNVLICKMGWDGGAR